MEWIKSRNPLDYKIALVQMEEIVDKIISGDAKETIWLLEHNEIYTAGTSTKDIHLKNIQINSLNEQLDKFISYNESWNDWENLDSSVIDIAH